MPFVVPEEEFDAGLHARRSLNAANHLERVVIDLFIRGYHEFWGVTDPATGSIYTTAQMQSKIEAMGMQTAISVLTSAAGLVAYITAAYPGVLHEKYESAAFERTVGESGLIIGNLKADWAAPSPVEEGE